MPDKFLAGYRGRVSLDFGALILHAKEWSLRLVADEWDATYAKGEGSVDAGFITTRASLQGAEGSVKAVLNDLDDPFQVRHGESIRPNSLLRLTLYVDKIKGQGFFQFFATAITVEVMQSVRGLTEYSFSFKSKGEIIYPKLI